MVVTKIHDFETTTDLEMNENDDNKIYLQLQRDDEVPMCITLDKDDVKEIVKALNNFING